MVARPRLTVPLLLSLLLLAWPEAVRAHGEEELLLAVFAPLVFALCAVTLAMVAKYIVARFCPRPLRDKGIRDFVVVGFCELSIVVIMLYAAFLAAVHFSVDLTETRSERLGALFLFSLLAILPNGLLLREQNTEGLLRFMKSPLKLLCAWLLALFVPAATVLLFPVALRILGLG